MPISIGTSVATALIESLAFLGLLAANHLTREMLKAHRNGHKKSLENVNLAVSDYTQITALVGRKRSGKIHPAGVMTT